MTRHPESLEVMVGRIDENVKELRRMMANHMEDDAAAHKEFRDSIGSLRDSRAKFKGAVGIMAFLVGGLGVDKAIEFLKLLK